MPKTKTSSTVKVAAWDRVWIRWVRATTPETRKKARRLARAWSTRTGESLPPVMQ